jgi:RND family efflux transporter MFP subunit
MSLHKLKTGILVVIAFVGMLLVAGGLAVGLHAQAGPKAETPGPGQAPEARTAGEGGQAGDKPVPGLPQPVTVSRPARREAAPYKVYVGRLEARRAVPVRPALGGVVVKVCFKAGAHVKQGDVLFELDPRLPQLALEKAEAELASAMAKRRQFEVELKNATKLKEDKVITQAEVNRLKEQAVALDAAVKAANVEVARARLDVDATKVTAPMSGQAGRPLVEPGEMVFRGQDRATLLTTITSLDVIGLTFDMDETSFLEYQRLLRDKQFQAAAGPLHMELAGEKNAFPHEGALDGFDNRVNPQTGTVAVRGSFPNPDRLLLPGMTARVRMAFGPPRAVLEIPEQAILHDKDMTYVLVVNDRNVAERRAVTLGQFDKDMRVIEKGLGAEDRVIIAGLVGVRPGDTVEPRRKALAAPSEPRRDRGH